MKRLIRQWWNDDGVESYTLHVSQMLRTDYVFARVKLPKSDIVTVSDELFEQVNRSKKVYHHTHKIDYYDRKAQERAHNAISLGGHDTRPDSTRVVAECVARDSLGDKDGHQE